MDPAEDAFLPVISHTHFRRKKKKEKEIDNYENDHFSLVRLHAQIQLDLPYGAW